MIECIFPDVLWNFALHLVTFLVESHGFLFWWLPSTLLMWVYQCKHVISRIPSCWHTASLYGWNLRYFIKILLKVEAEMSRLQARFLRERNGWGSTTYCVLAHTLNIIMHIRTVFSSPGVLFSNKDPVVFTFCISTPQSCVSFGNRSRRRNIEVPAKAFLGLGNEYR